MIQWTRTDLLEIRCLAVLSSSSFILFNLFAMKEPVWLPVYWNILFICTNAYQIRRLLLDRAELKLPQYEDNVFRATFKESSLTIPQFNRLVSIAERKQSGSNDAVICEHSVILVLRGSIGVHLRKDGRRVNALTDGDFFGEVKFLKKKERGDAFSPVGYFLEPTIYLEWDEELLRRFLGRNPVIAAAMSRVWMRKLADKVATIVLRDPDEDVRAGYKYILSAILSDNNITEGEREFLLKYRVTKSISDAVHESVLAELGWTADAYELCSSHNDLRLRETYTNLLRVMLADGMLQKNELAFLSMYRERHSIDDCVHRDALKELNWTEIEFDAAVERLSTCKNSQAN